MDSIYSINWIKFIDRAFRRTKAVASATGLQPYLRNLIFYIKQHNQSTKFRVYMNII